MSNEKNKRVIWTLEDGRKVYASKRGQPEVWSDWEIDTYLSNFTPYRAGYTPSGIYTQSPLLEQMSGDRKPLYHVSFEVEDDSFPINSKYLFENIFASEINVKTVVYEGELTPKLALLKRDSLIDLVEQYPDLIAKNMIYKSCTLERAKLFVSQYRGFVERSDVYIWEAETWQSSGQGNEAFSDCVFEFEFGDMRPMNWQFNFTFRYEGGSGLEYYGINIPVTLQQILICPVRGVTKDSVFSGRSGINAAYIFHPCVEGETSALPIIRLIPPIYGGERITGYKDIVARLKYMELTLVRKDRQHLSNNIVRQYTRKNKYVPEVSVIRLRKEATGEKTLMANRSSAKDFSCQWVVRGHWRQQYYPSKGRHQPIFIDEYIKGPEDKPLKEKAAVVFRVDR